jgi:hypothetical protein
MIYGDITRVFDTARPKLIYALLQRARATAQPATLICHAHQKASIEAPQSVRVVAVEDTASSHEIAKAVRDLILSELGSGGEPKSIEVFSFHADVISVSGGVPSTGQAPTNAYPWKFLRPDGRLSQPAQCGPTNTSQSLIDRGVTVLIDVLRRLPSGIHQSNLRNLVVTAEGMLDKFRGGPPMGVIIAAARARGLVTAEPWGHVNPWINLTAATQSDFPQLPLLDQTPGMGNAQSDTGGIVYGPGDNTRIDNASERPSTLSSAHRSTDANSTPLDPARVEAPGTEQSVPPVPTTIQRFFTIFRQLDFGPYRAERSEYLVEVERLVNEKTYSAGRLLKKAAKNVESGRKRQPWSVVEKFLRTLFSRCPVLLDEGRNPQSPSDPASASRPIVALAAGWRDQLDAEMLVFLAERDGEFKYSELDAAAFVIFPRSDGDEAMIRAEELFQSLLAQGRVKVINNVITTFSALTVVPLDKGNDSAQGNDEGKKTA